MYGKRLTLCMLGNFACFFLLSADFFSRLIFSKNSFSYTIRVSNTLDADPDQQNVGPNLGMNTFQRLLADNKWWEKVKPLAKIRPINPLGSCAYMFKEYLNAYMGKVPKSLQLASLCIIQ